MKLKQVNKYIEKIRLLPDAQVDCGTEQGSDVFFTQLRNHSSTPEMLDLTFDWYLTETHQCLAQIQDSINPHSLPNDYLFFLKHFGGITISDESFYFASLGFGPMVEEWYSYLMGDNGFYENGFLKIGFLRFRNSSDDSWKYIYFFLDLGNTIQRDSIIEVFGWKLGELDFQDVLNEPQSYSFCWSKIADSFTQWLGIIATTSGSFGHING